MQRPFNPQVSVLLSLTYTPKPVFASTPICFSKLESGENNKARSFSTCFVHLSTIFRNRRDQNFLLLNISEYYFRQFGQEEFASFVIETI